MDGSAPVIIHFSYQIVDEFTSSWASYYLIENRKLRGMARLVRICLFKFNLVLLNIRGRNGCGRIDGAAVVVVVVEDGGSVAGSVVGSIKYIIVIHNPYQKEVIDKN